MQPKIDTKIFETSLKIARALDVLKFFTYTVSIWYICCS